MKKVFFIIVMAGILGYSAPADAVYYNFEDPTLPAEFGNVQTWYMDHGGNVITPPSIDYTFVGTSSVRSYEGTQSLGIGTSYNQNIMIQVNYDLPSNAFHGEISWMQYDQYGGQSPYYMILFLNSSSTSGTGPYDGSTTLFSMYWYDKYWGGQKSSSLWTPNGYVPRVAGTWSEYSLDIANGSVGMYINDIYYGSVTMTTDNVDSLSFRFHDYYGGPNQMQIDALNIQQAPPPIDKMVTDIDPPKFNSDYWMGDDENNTQQLLNANQRTEEAWLEALLGKDYNDPSLYYYDRILKGTGGLGVDEKGLINYDPGFWWDYAVVKYDGYWIAYENTGNNNFLTTDTFDWGISHITFFRHAVPEPTSLLLLCLGLIGLAGVRKKFKQ